MGRNARGGPKRRMKVLHDNIHGITKFAMRRMARQGGVKIINMLIYKETHDMLKVFLENAICYVVII